ncbi:MAG TPA: DUF192 domain-containing protein [Chloroflexia bacterium]|nr:DUF192 domain-containing protein [Chloroflexia bacterium]
MYSRYAERTRNILSAGTLSLVLLLAACDSGPAPAPPTVTQPGAFTPTLVVSIPTSEAGTPASDLPTEVFPTPVSPTPLSAATATAPRPSTPDPLSLTPWVPSTALVGTPRPGAAATLTAAPRLSTATLTILNAFGEKVVVQVEIAGTEPSRELGLMFRDQMDPAAGMLFDFGADTNSGFWMQNTILPLSIAFMKEDGTIINVADMQPLDLTSVPASGTYRYALEVNQGFFRAHNIVTGSKALLPVGP